MAETPTLVERTPADGEDPPDQTGYVRCRGCGWYGAEEHTIWTDNDREECEGEKEDAELSCPMCHSADLADAYEPAALPTLAPCPFCGPNQPVSPYPREAVERGRWFYHCGMCQVRTRDYGSEEEARAAWNRRAAPPQDAERGEDECEACGGSGEGDGPSTSNGEAGDADPPRCEVCDGRRKKPTREQMRDLWLAYHEAPALQYAYEEVCREAREARARVAELEAERDRLREGATEAVACFEAAACERLDDVLSWAESWRDAVAAQLADLVRRRLLHAREALDAALTPPPAPAAQGETATEVRDG